MYPHDQVLVGAITRKKDLKLLQEQRWYRIPQSQMPRGILADYIAFFLNTRIAPDGAAGIHYFARRAGVELAYRRDLLPDEATHDRAGEVYYKVSLLDLQDRQPPIRNTDNRRFAFVLTTWDRFLRASDIKDLYSDADYFVDRIYHALRQGGVNGIERYWDAEQAQTGTAAQLRILCEDGVVTATTELGQGGLHLSETEPEDSILARIRAEIAKHGGPLMVNIPLD
jgi:hypothetical protein